jgi:hypothetical protein
MRIENIKLYDLYKHYKYDKYTCFFSNVEENVYDFKECLPKHALEEWESNCSKLKEECNKLDKNSRYLKVFESYDNLFSRLRRCKINILAYKAFLEVESNETVKSILKTFKPKSSYSNTVTYNKVSNVSGRLVVSSGPNILTLPKRCRSILESRFESGSILSVDFNALEPRLCLKLNNRDTDKDIYQLVNDMLEYDIDRSVIKRAIISVLYGAHYTSLKNITPEKAKELFECIKDMFGIDTILDISKNIDDLGIRRNYFGRPIWNLEEEKEHILINNCIQSSAVDIALSYFTELVETVDNDLAVPLFILHDAIIFDISDEYKDDFVNIVKKGYNNIKLGNFPLKTEIFNNNS